MTAYKARLIAAAVAAIALIGVAVWGYDQLRGRFMDIDEALAVFEAGDYRTAFRAAERLAPEGDIIAQTMLGWLYQTGNGTDEDFAAADDWLSLAAEQGHVPAMRLLADLHFYDYHSLDDGRLKNRPLAVEWYRRAAEAGNSYAQRRLALALIRGQGVDEDRAAGLAWMERSVEGGDRISMYRLGYIYESGEFGQQDFHRALDLYRQAIRRGEVRSARQAIELLRDERSPVQDIEEAYLWALIASQWWPDHPINGQYFVSVAETVHREPPTPPPGYHAAATAAAVGFVSEQNADEFLAYERAAENPETWSFRLDETARRRSEEAARAIIARWPEVPALGESIND